METFRAHVQFKVTDAPAAPAPAAEFSGNASVFNTRIDAHVPTVIEPGAFTRSLVVNRDRIKILWQHNTDEPIGRPLELREDARGLFLRAQLSATPRGREAAQLLRDGVITEMSIGFDPVLFYTNTSGAEPVRHITEVRLWEVSLVTFAANSQAKVTQVHRRHASIEDEVAGLEQMLADYDWRHGQRQRDESDPVLRQLRDVTDIARRLR